MLISWVNEWHLGDHLWHTILMGRLAQAGHEQRYYIDRAYHAEMADWMPSGATLHAMEDRPDDAICCWIGSTPIFMRRQRGTFCDYLTAYADYFNTFMRTFAPQLHAFTPDDSMVSPSATGDYAASYDVLLINSEPQSGQWPLDDAVLFKKAQQWRDQGLEVITTRKIAGFACTRDHGLTLFQIGRLARRVRYIVGIHTAPLVACLQADILDRISDLYVLDRRNGFVFPSRNNVHILQTNQALEALRL